MAGELEREIAIDFIGREKTKINVMADAVDLQLALCAQEGMLSRA